MSPTILEEIIRAVSRLLPEPPADLQKNLRAALGGVFERLELVTCEELEVQEEVLRRTRARLEEMEKRIAQFETKPN